jgi:hypothetical protein
MSTKRWAVTLIALGVPGAVVILALLSGGTGRILLRNFVVGMVLGILLALAVFPGKR